LQDASLSDDGCRFARDPHQRTAFEKPDILFHPGGNELRDFTAAAFEALERAFTKMVPPVQKRTKSP
jgi:hypothetical protein